ncbi:hypothetical protein Tco_0243197 [Tanacetum coccineum]
MKVIFEELEAEVDQNVFNRKHDEIEQKNLLIANDNLIADFFSKEVFYVATNSELNVSRFTEMHDAHTIVEARSLELEAELYKLRDKLSKFGNLSKLRKYGKQQEKCLSVLVINGGPRTKSKVVPAKQTKNVSTSKSLTRYQHRNQQYQAVLLSFPTSPENHVIAASMQYAIAYANQQEPNQN